MPPLIFSQENSSRPAPSGAPPKDLSAPPHPKAAPRRPLGDISNRTKPPLAAPPPAKPSAPLPPAEAFHPASPPRAASYDATALHLPQLIHSLSARRAHIAATPDASPRRLPPPPPSPALPSARRAASPPWGRQAFEFDLSALKLELQAEEPPRGREGGEADDEMDTA